MLGTQMPAPCGRERMQARATVVGGTLALFSAIGAGTQLRIFIPVQVDADG